MPQETNDAIERPNVGEGDAEERRDLLAYGTQVVLDGRAADVEKIGSLDRVEAYVRGALRRLETEDEPLVRTIVSADGPGAGVSAVARLGETGVMIHTFTKIGRLTVRLVTSRSVPVDAERRAVVEAFAVGRHQTHVTARFRTMAMSEETLERQLQGERDYAMVRLTEPMKL